MIFLDSGNPEDMAHWEPHVAGFTTNPSLLKKVGITDYREFSQAAITAAKGKPLSLEVLADDFETMEAQALILAELAENVYVKVPVVNSSGESSARLIRKLGLLGVRLNVTAVCTVEQVETAARSLIYAPAILSIFCGRIADTLRDPLPLILKATHVKHSDTRLLWASAREIYNVRQAEESRCDIITLNPELLKKLPLKGKDLREVSVETVKQFVKDGEGLTI